MRIVNDQNNTAADEYATESHVWDVTQLFGTKDGGTEGHYYRAFGEGMRGAGSAQDVVELVGAEGSVKTTTVDVGKIAANKMYVVNQTYGDGIRIGVQFLGITTPVAAVDARYMTSARIAGYMFGTISAQNAGFQLHSISQYQNDGYVCIAVPNCTTISQFRTYMDGVIAWYALATPITFTSLFLSASSTADELTAMPADAIPLSEIQFADCNWSIEEAIYDAPEEDANGVITPTAVTGQMRIQYSLDAAEQIDTLQKEYAALEARVSALENA